jgi:oligoendopeptidase F
MEILMKFKLPASSEELLGWEWSNIEPGYMELEKTALHAGNVEEWLAGWSRVAECVDELYNRLYVASSVNTIDEVAEKRFANYFDTIFPKAQACEQKLKLKLLESKFEPAGFEIPLRNYRSEVDLFRDENLPLFAEEQKLGTGIDKIVGAQTVNWNGKETTIQQLGPYLQSADRETRKRAWEAQMSRIYVDRDAINEIWVKNLVLRQKIAKNAGKKDYREFKWQQQYRFDYTPQDCLKFHAAIEAVVVPAVKRLLERHGKQMGIDTVRPWDIDLKNYVDPLGRPPLKPFKTVEEQVEKTQAIFNHVDPVLGGYFHQTISDGNVDIPNRKNKGGGAYCTGLSLIRKPFVFCNSVGTQDDVRTLVHESGHSFHVYETANLPYFPQLNVTMEMAEVASMGMELLVTPYLEQSMGGFYTPRDAARAVSENLITSLLFWPYMAVVDAFQHWVYLHPEKAMIPENCDAEWGRQWDRFMQGYDWTGYEDFKNTGWHRKTHIHQIPFYYVEYGLAQLGAVQVYGNALKDQAKAVADYRFALSLGATRALPELFKAAGAKLAFDEDILKKAVELMETQIVRLEKLALSKD